jgi:hypothetical protein
MVVIDRLKPKHESIFIALSLLRWRGVIAVQLKMLYSVIGARRSAPTQKIELH